MSSIVTYKYIRQNPDIMEYIRRADHALEVQGYTEHSFAHVELVAQNAGMILTELGYDERTVELARIAGMLHDIGNVINRIDHAQSGAVMAFRLLDNMSMPAAEICSVISAIGNHDDVRRSRVRNNDFLTFDIHDRVNFAVKKSSLYFNENKTAIILDLEIDTEISPVIEYFEIFLNRMLLCKRACSYLGLQFKMIVNGSSLL